MGMICLRIVHGDRDGLPDKRSKEDQIRSSRSEKIRKTKKKREKKATSFISLICIIN